MEDGNRPATRERRTRRDRALFDHIADAYCRKDLLPAHRRARRLRLFQTLSQTEKAQNGDLLEIGCGAGFAASYLRGRYRSFYGIDHSAKLVDLANSINQGPDTTFETADASTVAIDRRFDVIFMIGVLHHLPDPAATIRHLAGFLNPDGSIVVNEPHSGNPFVQLARSVRMKIDPHYSNDQTIISGKSLGLVFEEAGCELVKLIPQGLLSTPFAEVVMPVQAVASPLSSLACAVDRTIENAAPWALRHLSWNLIAVAKPGNSTRR